MISLASKEGAVCPITAASLHVNDVTFPLREAIVKVCGAGIGKQDIKRPKGIKQINKILPSKTPTAD